MACACNKNKVQPTGFALQSTSVQRDGAQAAQREGALAALRTSSGSPTVAPTGTSS